ncbi:hypothetical protein [Neorhizobium tomejilense]|nr:hypothetical protein [Neorhizobium tomejilense]
MNTPHYDQKVGIAFAGNAIAASQTMATMLQVCQELHTGSQAEIPALGDIAFLTARVAKHYVTELRQSLNDMSSVSQLNLIVFGFCPVRGNLETWTLADEVKDREISVSCRKHLMKVGVPITIGSQRHRFEEQLS